MYHGFFPARNPRVHPLKETPIVSTGGWTDVILPFNTFIVSSRGRMKTVPLELDTVKLEHVVSVQILFLIVCKKSVFLFLCYKLKRVLQWLMV